MSRFLKNKEVLACMIALLLAAGITFTNIWPLSAIFLLVAVVIIINKLLKRHLYKNLDVLYNRTSIKEIKTLVIGDNCDIKDIPIDRDSTVFFQSADRSFNASYQIFMHVESLLENGGRLIFINDTKVNQEAITIFDIFYLHPITRKELKIEELTLKSKYPLMYEPIKSLKNILRLNKKGFKQIECKDNLYQFCKERNIELVYLSK